MFSYVRKLLYYLTDEYGFQANDTSFFFSSTYRGVRPGAQGLFLQMLRSLPLLLVRQTRCKFAWHESHRAQAARKASLTRWPEMRSYQLWKRKKSERLLRMGEEKWPLQVREQRGLCLQCLERESGGWGRQERNPGNSRCWGKEPAVLPREGT